MDPAAVVDAFVNAVQTSNGLAYLTLYTSTPEAVRTRFVALATAATGAGSVWAADRSGGFTLTKQADVGPDGALVLPKLFRRWTDYLKAESEQPFLDWLNAQGGDDDPATRVLPVPTTGVVPVLTMVLAAADLAGLVRWVRPFGPFRRSVAASVLWVSTPVPPPGLYTQPPVGVPPALADRPVEAADPAVLTNGQVIPRQVVPAPAVGGAFTVDLDRAPQVLRDLHVAVSELRSLRRDALELGKVDPGSRDQVSVDAARVLGAVAVGGPGSLVDAVTAGIERLEALIAAIESELRAYGESDLASSDSFDART